ncbi:MAG: YbjN domain-containing protein [Persicimonas sp.]
MTTNDQIEAYLIETELPFELVEDGLWLIHDETDFIDNIVLIHAEPVVTFRVKLMEAPKEGRLELFTRLLELNATSMITGAFGLEDEAVVIVDTLQSENLDYNEFQGAIDSIALAIREHYEELREYSSRDKQSSREAVE